MRRFGSRLLLNRLPCRSLERCYCSPQAAPAPSSLDASFLRSIISEHQQSGRRLALPFADDAAMKRILEPLNQLKEEGVHINFLHEALATEPALLAALVSKGPHCMQVLERLVDTCSFTYESALRLFSENITELMAVDAEELARRLHLFTGRGLANEGQLGRLIRRCPAVLYSSSADKMDEVIEYARNFFSRKDIISLFNNVPHFVLRTFEEIEQKYEYVYFHMRCEPSELAASLMWVDRSLDEIMARHEFVLKTGKYTMPDEKRPQIKADNPPLYRVIDTEDSTFAHQVAGVTSEEWSIFQALRTKLTENEDKEHPFERVKPSVRKAYERRRKEQLELEEHQLL